MTEPDGFAVLRTPLLPFDELANLSEGLCGDTDLAGDRAAVRARIEALLGRDDVRDAIALASPSLAAALARTNGDRMPEKLLRAGYRYLARMCTRPTPFGLFAGTSLARVGARTSLALGPRSQQKRATTVDPQVLTALAETLAQRPEVRARLEFRPNSSLYEAGGRARYARARSDGARRRYELAAADLTPALQAMIERSRTGASPAKLTQVLIDGGAEPAAAARFVDSLIDAQILVGDLVPPVTGADPLSSLSDRLETVDPAAARTVADARERLAAIDAGGVGAAADGYQPVVAVLRELPGEADPARALIADLIRPLAADEVGRDVVAEVRRAVELVTAMTPAPSGTLGDWRAAFQARFEGREVPLAEALDEELGIGYQPSKSPAADASPLLRGLPWVSTPTDPTFGARGRRLLALVDRARADRSVEVRLTDDDVEALRAARPAALPDAFSAMTSVQWSDGDFRVRLLGATGPSGARLLGRICHADPDVAESVRAHIAREEALRPEAVFAEVVHLPEGATGKLIARPLLRDHEIEFLGRSGAPAGAVIGLDDLLVSVQGERIVLRSQRLDREVLPRLTSAHNHQLPGTLGAYRFLGALQSQDCAAGMMWNWGPLEAAPFLPRVARGRSVLARARWLLNREEIGTLATAGDDRSLHRAAAALRERRGLPRWVALADADNELVVDLDNIVALDTLVRTIAARPQAALVELWPDPESLLVTGGDGSYTHELIVPFVAERAVRASAPPERTVATPVKRTFLPGSEWLYAKLYTGTATADQLLRDTVAPLVRTALDSGAADRWFFIRYADPDWHLRLRLHGDAERLMSEVVPALHEAAERERAAGRLWRLELSTYEREVERYGGPYGLAACEEIFHADSDAVLEILETGAGADDRWRLALAGIALLLDELIEDPGERRQLVSAMRDGYGREHDAGRALFKAVGDRWRSEGADLRTLLAGAAPGPLAERSRRSAGAVERLRSLEREGELSRPLAEVAGALVHMHANRLLRSAGRAHELVLLDLLARAYAAEAARR